jgi:hypothetical protein
MAGLFLLAARMAGLFLLAAKMAGLWGRSSIVYRLS